MESIQSRRKANQSTWRVCDVCRRPTDGLSSLCPRHIHRRARHGSVKITHYVRFRDYAHLVGLARTYLKAHPPDQPVLDSMARFLQPPDAIPKGSRTPGG